MNTLEHYCNSINQSYDAQECGFSFSKEGHVDDIFAPMTDLQ